MTETDDRDKPGPEPGIFRPSTAPAYYLGRPARLWITVMRPRRRRTTSDHPVQAVTGGGKQAHHGTAAGRKIRSPLIPARFFPHPATRPARDRCEMTWPVSSTGPWSPPTSR